MAGQPDMTPIALVRGVGPKTLPWLQAAGVETLGDLRTLGVIEVYRRCRAMQRGVSLNLLWALQGMVLGCSWLEIPPEMKDGLRQRLAASEQESAPPP